MTGGMDLNIRELRDEYNQGKLFSYMFFWGHTEKDGELTKACLSQWYDCKFTENGITYHTAEQYMMSQKAKLFRDEEIFESIMQADNPGEYKKLGRKIRNFDSEIWNKNKFSIVVNGNMLKFSQNEKLKDFLLSTGGRVLVEASPYDCIWGIGKSMSDKNIENPLTWKGENLLGFALMEVRERLG